ncbi:hypothetical protein O1L68_23065 [Streptomyces lydicus]|nr:hypothetical protein [Streptomyces lydicus]
MAGNTADLGIQGCTNFENASHQALYDMVADGDHLLIVAMGADLVDAGKEIARITDDLEAYAQQTHAHWKGEGAQAFDDWTKATATESRKLGHYAKNTGEAMTDAATALGQAKLMPRPPELRNFVETNNAKPNGVTALTKDPAREEALAEMNRLASYYRTAQAKIAQQEAPNFRPASGFVPDPKPTDGRFGDDFYVLDQQTGSRAVNGGGGAGSASSRHDSGSTHTPSPQPTSSGEQQGQQVGTSVDSAPPVTVPESRRHHGEAVPPTPGSPGDSPGPAAPGPAPIPGGVKAPTGHGSASGQPKRVSGQSGTPRRQHGSATEDGIIGGTARPGNTEAGRHPRLPGGTVMGTEPGTVPPRPIGPKRGAPTENGATGMGPGSFGEHPVAPYGEVADKPRGSTTGAGRSSMSQGVTSGGYPGSASSGIRENARRAGPSPGL